MLWIFSKHQTDIDEFVLIHSFISDCHVIEFVILLVNELCPNYIRPYIICYFELLRKMLISIYLGRLYITLKAPYFLHIEILGKPVFPNFLNFPFEEKKVNSKGCTPRKDCAIL